MRKKIRVGFDFDGVVAYNPLRVVRSSITFVKKKILRRKNTAFTIPKGGLPRFIWRIAHDTSFFPSRGTGTLRKLVETDRIEAYLISGRFGYLEDHLNTWLTRNKMKQYFTKININKNDEQPHKFKERTIRKLGLDFYIEDNWDIVEHLSKTVPETKVYWVTNIVDRYIKYPRKYNSLEEILENIMVSFRGGRS
jgi:hypothetical protein